MPSSRPPARPLADYVSPLQPVPKTAVLICGFREAKRVRVFPEGWGTPAIRFRPEVLAAGWEDLLTLAREWKSDWTAPTRGFVIFSSLAKPSPPVHLRDLLWDRFGLPVFEQVLGANRELLASECEAHEGLHLHQPGIHHPGYALRKEICACGGQTPRLCRIEEPEQALAMASGA